MARDILLFHVYAQKGIRATRDVDLGLYLETWDQFHQLKDALCNTGKFSALDDSPHRLLFGQPVGVPLDLIPFGQIELPAHSIAWPPGHQVVLNVAGFIDAYSCAVSVDLGQSLVIKTCALPSLAVLKLIAWKDRRNITSKDATDFFYVAQKYAYAGNLDRLYTSEQAVLAEANHDPVLAGATLLGMDAVRQVQEDTAALILEILGNPTLLRALIDHLLRANAGSIAKEEGQVFEDLVLAFKVGFLRMCEQTSSTASQAIS